MSGSVSRCLRDRGRAERPTTMRPRGRDRPQVGTGRRGRPRTDRGDHPKWVAVVGYGLSALTRVGLLVATGFAAVTALVAVDRVGKGIRTAPRDAMITASSSPRTLGRSFGVHRTLDTVGASVGPLLAFVVLWAVPDGYHTVFVVSFGFAVIGLVVLALLVPDVRPRRAAWLERHRTRQTRGLPPCKGCTCSAPGLTAAGRPFAWRTLTSPRCGACSSSPAVWDSSPSATASSTWPCRTATASRRSGSPSCTSGPTSHT